LSAPDPAALKGLTDILDPARISFDEADLQAHSRDWAPAAILEKRAGDQHVPPACVVRPTATREVAALLSWAHETRTPVVPFGSGSGVLRGIRPEGAIVIDMGEMWGITDLDEKSLLVTVQAGVTGPQLREALDQKGFMLGHEPQSHDISSVGGWVATRASGQLSARYGGIEELVAGLEAVLPGGTVVRSKVVPRRATGPDVASLMIGSEGTLGVITEVTLRVSRIPESRADRCIRFEHMADGVAACRRLAQSELGPTVVRLYDRDDAALFLRNHPDEPQGPLLILSFDGDRCAERADEAVSLSASTEGNHSLVAHWWEHRNDAVDEFRKVMDGEGLLGSHGVVETMEVAGTWSVLRDLYHTLKEALGAEADAVGCHLSHIYPDGACLYFTMGSFTDSDEAARDVLERWWRAGMETCLEAGGSISHHHGIGRTKAPWLQRELGGWWEVLKAVKETLDPHGIMNPGALGL
jgi:alkyldihydroxyacetonephosphate synthase